MFATFTADIDLQKGKPQDAIAALDAAAPGESGSLWLRSRFIYLSAFHYGRLRGFRRQLALRLDHSIRLWTGATLHMAALALQVAAAGFLTWMSADPSGWS